MVPKVKVLLGLGVLTASAAAQLGRPIPPIIDVTGPLGGNVGGLGVVRVPGPPETFYVSVRRLGAAPNPHFLQRFDNTGALVGAQIPQPSVTSTSAWGIRDMAYDGQFIWGGLEGNVLHQFDPVTNTYPGTTITVGAGPTVIRALAYNPNGNSGAGSFWTGNFNSNLYEFDRTGAILRTVPNPATPGNYGAVYGAGYDPQGAGGQGSVWWFSQNDPPYPTTIGVYQVEMNAVTATPTGQVHMGNVTIPGAPPGGIAGGMDMYDDAGTPTMLMLTQANVGIPGGDAIYRQVGRYEADSCTPIQERMQTTGGPPCAGATGNATFGVRLSNIPGNIAITQLTLAAPGAFPPLPPLLPCGYPGDLSSAVFLGTAPPAGGVVNFPLPIPANTGLPIHAELYAIIVEINFGPPLVVTVTRICIVFTS